MQKIKLLHRGIVKKMYFCKLLKIEKSGYEKNIYTPFGYGICGG